MRLVVLLATIRNFCFLWADSEYFEVLAFKWADQIGRRSSTTRKMIFVRSETRAVFYICDGSINSNAVQYRLVKAEEIGGRP